MVTVAMRSGFAWAQRWELETSGPFTLRRPDFRNGSFPSVQAPQRHGRSTSLSGPAEPERADLAIRHRRGATVLAALGTISGPAAKRTSYRQTAVSAE